MFNLQNDRRISCHLALCLGFFVNDTTDHHVDNIVLRGLFGDERSDIASVAHNRNSVRDDLDLIHTVRDIYDTHLLFAKVLNDLEEIFYLCFRKSC